MEYCSTEINTGSRLQMNRNTLKAFCHAVYECFQQRVSTASTPSQMALHQLRRLCQSCSTPITGLLDRAHDATWLWCQLSALPLEGTLVRLKLNRCLYRAAPVSSSKRRAPCKDGDTLQPNDPSSHGNPLGMRVCQDEKGRPVKVIWWLQLHLKEAAAS